MQISETPRVTLATPEHRAGLLEVARQAGIVLDVDAEFRRRFALLWAAWLPGHATAAGFLLAWDVADEMHVIDVATRPALRRRGVARALLRTALAHARARQARLLLLEVRRGNAPAISLYEGHGFVAANVRPGYYADGEDAVEMALVLPTPTATAHHQPET